MSSDASVKPEELPKLVEDLIIAVSAAHEEIKKLKADLAALSARIVTVYVQPVNQPPTAAPVVPCYMPTYPVPWYSTCVQPGGLPVTASAQS